MIKFHYQVTNQEDKLIFASQVPEQGSDTVKQALTKLRARARSLRLKAEIFKYRIFAMMPAKCITVEYEGEEFMFLEQPQLEDTYAFFMGGVRQEKGLSLMQVQSLLEAYKLEPQHSDGWSEVEIPASTKDSSYIGKRRAKRKRISTMSLVGK